MMDKRNYKQVRNILLGIFVLNILVAAAKIIYGVITKTSSMTADGYHSLSDGTSNIVGLIGIWIASKPADEGHPYGHHKFETLATGIIGLLLFFVSYQILIEAYERFRNPQIPEINGVSFGVMIITLVVNMIITKYEDNKGKELKSAILISDASHTKSDIYVSLSVIVSLIAVKFNFLIMDTIVAVVIAVLIIKAGLEVLIPSINVLSDASVIDSEQIYGLVMNFPNVIYCHKIRTRGKENYIMMDLHVGANKSISLEEAHTLSHDIKDRIIQEFQDIREVIIHMEPAERK
ncbi:cation diffusion facilitator family transporter [Anaerosolibacter carboniphilus]|uniref:Cation diffusion facilitator family transporter n=1 Tax=Anaerosolibacter carboniphilus TaxID=1417629 RepID=A0A841KS39_9FIRM|nr:cation diffusion facilitator family transporter [Anaerosolibacter carboniphilus]MBB6216213.1 cation diffusion facilitator family transporter [Anaerosolibacter carboniphilus]